jgi:hypothetical protein
MDAGRLIEATQCYQGKAGQFRAVDFATGNAQLLNNCIRKAASVCHGLWPMLATIM